MTDWKFFVLGKDRTPLPNCHLCNPSSKYYVRHAAADCSCLTCHGFYAATDDPTDLAHMTRLYPHNQWAVRTGSASGILVIDVEGPTKDPAGYETLHSWGDWMGWHLPEVTLQAKSPSGGLHLYFEFPGEGKIASRNRILPGVDLKADGGYVVVPSENSPGRFWERRGAPTVCTPEMVEWLATARGSGAAGASSGRPVGYDYEAFLRDGCPEGAREEFFNDLLFRLRKRGVSQQDARTVALEQWKRCEQTNWFWEWRHVEYKLHRIWATVDPNKIEEWQAAWLEALNDRAGATSTGWPTGRVGRVTIV